jgi:hypothetical protein
MIETHKHKWLKIPKKGIDIATKIFDQLERGPEIQYCEGCTMIRQNSEWKYFLNEINL